MPELGKQFHGSRFAFLEPGDFIEPGSAHGIQQFNYGTFKDVETASGASFPRGERVYSTDSEEAAWNFAEMTTMRAGPVGRVLESRDTGGRPYVYEVEPIAGEFTKDPHAPGEMASARARVVNRIDIPPPEIHTDTFDEFEFSENNPTGTAGTTNEERTARQGQLAGQGINWPNYDVAAWYGFGEEGDEDPEVNELAREFTGMGPSELDAQADEQWHSRREEQMAAGRLSAQQFNHPRLF